MRATIVSRELRNATRYGGNVPYRIEGLFVTDRLSQEWRSFCSVSVPDYVGGADGSPGSTVLAALTAGPMATCGSPAVLPRVSER